MKFLIRPIGFVIFYTIVNHCITPVVCGQGKTLQEVRNEQEQIKKEIEYTNVRLIEAGRKKKATLGQVKMINKKINERQRLIDNYNSEINIIDQNIIKNGKEIDSIKDKISEQKDYYAVAIRNYNRLIKERDGIIGLIFSAKSFNQAYNRIRYVGEFIKYQKKLFKQLEENIEILQNKNDEMESIKNDRKNLVQDIDKERGIYLNEKRNKQHTINQLQNQERRLRREIEQKNDIAKRLASEINRIIAEEREKKNTSADLTPAEKIISDQFSENQGRLPWPTEKGIVIDEFGEKAHPVLKNVKVNNEGIDVLTQEGEKARAIFKGTVSRVVAIPGANEVVIIKHGEYFTVYQNLINVRVRSGQTVDTNEILGDVYTDGEKNETILHFEVWKGRNVQNPEKWIAKGK